MQENSETTFENLSIYLLFKFHGTGFQVLWRFPITKPDKLSIEFIHFGLLWTPEQKNK